MTQIRTLLALSVSLLFATVATHAADRPNILWITSEDNGPELGCYGDDYAITPHLDALADRGMRYTVATSNAPVCAPARTTIISGLHPTSTGAEHMRSEVRLPDHISLYPEFLREAGYYCTNNSKTDYNLFIPGGHGTIWDESTRKAHWKNRPESKPFFSIFNHAISHESQIRNKIGESDQIHDPAEAPIPAYHPDHPEVREDWTQYYDRITMLDTRAGRNLRELEAAGLSEDTIVFYYGDHGSGMPRSKRWPYFSGLNVPLIVYFPEKWRHLAPTDYEPGGSSDRLVGFIDLAPTLLSLTGQEAPEWMQGHAFAGTHQSEEPEYSYGYRGRMDERYDMVRTVMDKRFIYLRHYMPHRIYGQFLGYMFETPTTRVWQELNEAGALNETQSLFWREKPVEELYDYRADPDEVDNLANSEKPEHRAALTALRDAHRNWVLKTRDIGFLAEGEIHRRAEAAGLTPYELAQNKTLYHLEAIYEAATLATSQSRGDLDAIVGLLSNEDSGVRFWGASGLLIHGETGYSAGRQALNRALEDANPSVAIVAAEVLGRFGSPAERNKAVEHLLVHANQNQYSAYDAIFALNALDYVGDAAKPHLEGIKALPKLAKKGPERITRRYAGALIERLVNQLSR
jgi:uncharacterized sulfatase